MATTEAVYTADMAADMAAITAVTMAVCMVTIRRTQPTLRCTIRPTMADMVSFFCGAGIHPGLKHFSHVFISLSNFAGYPYYRGGLYGGYY